MRQSLRLLLAIALLTAVPVSAQNWSLGLGAGPFVFGDFVRQTLRPIGGTVGNPTTIKLSAKTRPGASIDIERDIAGWLAIRLEGAFTHSKLAVRTSNAGGVTLDAGTIDVTTVMAPLVLRFNQRGTFRFHVMGGPAYAMYDIHRTNTPAQSNGAFEGTRSQWGGAAGGGVGWWFSNRFAVEGQITDIITSSPFHRSEIGDSETLKIPKPQNVHTTVGIRVRF
jgi:hypothetical protein